MTINLRTAINFIILLVLASTPFISYGEVSGLLSGEILPSELKTPIYIKIIKDIGFMLIMIVSLIDILNKKSRQLNFMFFWILSLVIIMLFLLSCIASSFSTAAAGIRWAIPIMLPFFLIQYMDDFLMNRIAKLLLLIFIVHLLMQVYQLFYMPNFYGLNIMGLAARSPGIFFMPNAAGFFSIMALFFVIFFSDNRSIKIIMFILTVISIALTMSGTAIMAYLLFVCFVILSQVLGRKYGKLLFQIVPLMIIIFSPTMVLLSGRGDAYVEDSFMPRVGTYINLLKNSELISTRFGAATNTATLYGVMVQQENVAIVTDSTYSSIIGNTGYLGLLLFILLFILFVIYAIKANRIDLYLFIIIYAIYGATTVIFEAFPMNFLFSIYIAYFLRNRFKRRQPCLKKDVYSIA